MAQSDIDLIYKSLRLLPDFDGNPHILTRFINLCDQLVLTHFRTEPGSELTNLALINGILNKVTGPAARLINSNGIPDTWQGIKNALINNFADHRDETALYSDLSLQTQGSSTPQEFYERCQNIFSTIMTYVSLHEHVPTTVQAKRDLYQKLTLQAFLRGLKDPLGCRVRCMRPETMEKALEFVQEELNTLYLQQRNEGGARPKEVHHSPQHSHMLPLNNFVPKQVQFQLPTRQPLFNMAGPFRPQMPPQSFHGYRPAFPSHLQPPRGPTRTQQIMRTPPQNYNPQHNSFRMPMHNQQPSSFNNANNHPRPMSGVSHFVTKTLPPTRTLHDWSKFGNPPPSNYFKTRELNFNEFDHGLDDYYNYDGYAEYDQGYYAYEHPEIVDYQEYPYTETATVEEIDQTSTPLNNENFHKESGSERPK